MQLSDYKFRLLLLGTSVALASCGGGSSSPTGTSTLNLGITDGPVDSAQEVVIEFDGVSLQPVNGDRINFDFDPVSVDLLTLQGTATEDLLNSETIPAGDYSWIRLAVNAEEDGVFDSYIILEDGSQLELRIPSGAERGLQLNTGFTVAAGNTYNFTIDFDLRKSVTNPPGQSGAILRPTLRMVNNIEVGSISGAINSNLLSTACENVTENDGAVYLFAEEVLEPGDIQGGDNDPITSALVDSQWNYEIGFVAEGNYKIAYTCDNELDDPEAADELDFYGFGELSVTAGGNTIVDFASDAPIFVPEAEQVPAT